MRGMERHSVSRRLADCGGETACTVAILVLIRGSCTPDDCNLFHSEPLASEFPLICQAAKSFVGLRYLECMAGPG